ncbi:MAG: cache domain-containing protein [Nitrospirae bacterium]|nr:cache domain-containing protein [Nitrospirota bacterium]
MFHSIKSKILLLVIGTLVMTTAVIMAWTLKDVSESLIASEQKSAQKANYLIRLYIESEYNNLIAHKTFTIETRKRHIIDTANLIVNNIDRYYEMSQKSIVSEAKAKELALEATKKIRYGNNDYFFIYNREMVAISHPDPAFMGKDLSNFQDIKGNYVIRGLMAVATSKDSGGFYDYWWKRLDDPRPVQKLGYSVYYPKWDWMIGTGVYVDDIEKEYGKELEFITEQIRESIFKMAAGKTGYIVIFNSSRKLIVHPAYTKDRDMRLDPLTGRPIIDELIDAAKTPDKPFYYMWNKPSDPGNFKYMKEAYVTYFAPLDWYIATTLFEDEIKQPANATVRKQLVIVALILILSVILSFFMTNRLSKPIKMLTEYVHGHSTINLTSSQQETTGIETLPSMYNDEVGRLAEAFLSNISQRDKAQKELIAYQNHLEELVDTRTNELNMTNKQLEEDIEKRKQVEESLRQSQSQLVEAEKMAALGGLVAGVAHEINTPIGIAVTTASHLQDVTHKLSEAINNKTAKKDELFNYFIHATKSSDLILTNLERTSELVKSFKMVSADQTSHEMRVFNVRDYIEKVITSLRPRLKQSACEVRIECPEDLEINSYPGAMAQIVTNFVINSLMHAFNAGDRGIITIEAIKTGDSLLIKFSDNGKGIPEENLGKIFNPFFTTNRAGGGTGLGLHILYNLITQTFKGTITCESTVGQGTTFSVTIPMALAA